MSVTPCPPNTPVVLGVVVFNPTDFKAAFPEFSTIPDAVLNSNFSLAQLQLNNSCGSRVCDANLRETLLNLLVAHITQLRNGTDAGTATGLVGRISYAMEGSVMATADMGSIVLGQAYYMQTQWGATYWASTARFRTFRYVPAPVTCADEDPGFYPGNGCGCG